MLWAFHISYYCVTAAVFVALMESSCEVIIASSYLGEQTVIITDLYDGQNHQNNISVIEKHLFPS